MSKRLFVVLVAVLVVGLAGVWFLTEGDTTPPDITLSQTLQFIGQNQELEFLVQDNKSGIKFIQVLIRQGDSMKEVSKFALPKAGVLRKQLKFNVKPLSLGLKDGTATLIISATDHSFFDNETTLERKVTIDTHPPRIGIRSLNHYVSIGGSCLVVYTASQDALKNGVLVGDALFEGYPVGSDGTHVAYFALPWDASTSTPIMLTAQDSAGNMAKITFPHLIRNKRFKDDKLNISDDFLNRKMPEFTNRFDGLGGNNLDIFLRVNRQLRQENNRKVRDVCSKSHPKRLWEGSFLRMRGSEKAQFADKRTYLYNGKPIDEQVHMGVDIAAIKQFPLKAANNGIVVFADYLGIYGNTIIIDHGHALFSMYSHLSRFRVKSGVEVKKGDIIGNTGATGLAGGDHLHFGIIVHDTYVDPKEWWDTHWIKDNITAKLETLRSRP